MLVLGFLASTLVGLLTSFGRPTTYNMKQRGIMKPNIYPSYMNDLGWLPTYMLMIIAFSISLYAIVRFFYKKYTNPNRKFAKFLKEARIMSDTTMDLFTGTVSSVAGVATDLTVTQSRGLSDKALLAKMIARFGILKQLVRESIDGNITSLIISGPAGLGKSFPVAKALTEADVPHTISKGFARATGLFKLLYAHRHPGSVLVLDDIDSIFGDEVSLNMLKAALDTTEVRTVSYLSERALKDDETGDKIPKTFDFHGTVIFISNLDFDHEIDKGNKIAEHLKAMISRSHYVDLDMNSKRHSVLWIEHIATVGLFQNKGLTAEQELEVVDFIKKNVDKLRELSLRMALKIADLRRGDSSNWKEVAAMTTFRNDK